jgi:hypothetical protein
MLRQGGGLRIDSGVASFHFFGLAWAVARANPVGAKDENQSDKSKTNMDWGISASHVLRPSESAT